MLMFISQKDSNALSTIETYIDEKFPVATYYVSAKPSQKKITFAPNVFQIPELSIEPDLVIQSVNDLNRLEKWLNSMWSRSNQSTFMVFFSLISGASIVLISGIVVGKFVGFGFSISAFLVSLPLAMAIYLVLRILTLPSELADYQLDVYESDPANSEVIQRLIYIMNVHLYYVAGYQAVGTLFGAVVPELSFSVWYFVLLGWVPRITQFLANQYAIRKIIIGAKWRNLNRLQAQIREIQNASLSNAPEMTITRLHRLMDLHDRISAKPNSILNWGTGLSFLNQLMLPLLGLLLGNIDKILRLLNPNSTP